MQYNIKKEETAGTTTWISDIMLSEKSQMQQDTY